jgi:hypothetical protein
LLDGRNIVHSKSSFHEERKNSRPQMTGLTIEASRRNLIIIITQNIRNLMARPSRAQTSISRTDLLAKDEDLSHANSIATSPSHLDRDFFRPFRRYGHKWWLNRDRIVHLAVVNVIVTVVMEAIVRSIMSGSFLVGGEFSFIVASPDGTWLLNRQSIASIWLTALTSLFGGPVYFIQKKSHRYMFFVSFGLLVSVCSQAMTTVTVSWMTAHPIVDALKRILFDVLYCATLKFALFEFTRNPILSRRVRASMSIGMIRLAQDFTSTSVRIFLLNLLGFRG